jgi:hypothetical protein
LRTLFIISPRLLHLLAWTHQKQFKSINHRRFGCAALQDSAQLSAVAVLGSAWAS